LNGVHRNQYMSLCWYGAWQQGSTRQAIATNTGSLYVVRRLAMRWVPPGDSVIGLLELMCLAMRAIPLGSVWNSGCFWGTMRLAVHIPPLSGLEAGSAWRYVSPAKRFWCCILGLLDSTCVIYQAFGGASKVGLLVFLELSSERIPWVELGIGVKHVAFLELSSEWHPTSWARDGRWTRGTRELSSGLASVVDVSVLVVSSTDGSREIVILSS